jgi:hypothetical protein
MLTGCSEFNCSDKECIQKKIDESTELIEKLKLELDDRLKPKQSEYEAEYKKNVQEVTDGLNDSPIKTHEELLKKCNQYYDVCNKLERAAVLKYSTQFLDSKIRKIDFQISQLEQNVWKINKKMELSEIASTEEQDKINELIAKTKIIIEDVDKTPPLEAQDVAKIQQDIFNNIIKK